MRSRTYRSVLCWVERSLWLLAAIALGTSAVTWASSGLYQAWAKRSFVQTLQNRLDAPRRLSSPPPEYDDPAAGHSSPPPEVPAASPPWLGRLDIPRIGVSVMILEGSGAGALRNGVGHIAGTAPPGSAGNVALAGHRDTFFRRIGELEAGDTLSVTTLDGVYEYVFDSAFVVPANAVEILQDTTSPALTLVTCYPFGFVGSAPDRYIVRARLVQALELAAFPSSDEEGWREAPGWR